MFCVGVLVLRSGIQLIAAGLQLVRDDDQGQIAVPSRPKVADRRSAASVDRRGELADPAVRGKAMAMTEHDDGLVEVGPRRIDEIIQARIGQARIGQGKRSHPLPGLTWIALAADSPVPSPTGVRGLESGRLNGYGRGTVSQVIQLIRAVRMVGYVHLAPDRPQSVTAASQSRVAGV